MQRRTDTPTPSPWVRRFIYLLLFLIISYLAFMAGVAIMQQHWFAGLLYASASVAIYNHLEKLAGIR